MTERGLTFGSVAAAYERFRLGYSGEVVERVLAYADRPVATALEIGAGTGKATREFTSRGVAVTAVEPDVAMLAELQRRVTGPLTPVHARFEAVGEAGLTDLGPFDLVYAAAALHWTDPETRWTRIAALLPPGGVFASFGGPMSALDDELRERVESVSRPYVDDAEFPSPDGSAPDAPMLWPGTELERSGLFADVTQLVVERRPTLSADEVVGQLSTVSAYLVLPADRRREVLGKIRAELPEQVEIFADVTLHLARRAVG